jgi:hypothetical protein
MKIACLGWGSLIWDPKALPTRGPWFNDGPLLPIEFARKSGDGRITLVITDVNNSVRSLWALMNVTSLNDAKQELAEREGIKAENVKYSIGFCEIATGVVHGTGNVAIQQWAADMHLDGVVWTNLNCGLDNDNKLPPYEKILQHLRSLPHARRQAAEEYVRKAPLQIDTEYRRGLQRDLGWLPTT